MNKRFVAGSRIVVENMLVYCIWKDLLLMVLVVSLVTSCYCCCSIRIGSTCANNMDLQVTILSPMALGLEQLGSRWGT